MLDITTEAWNGQTISFAGNELVLNGVEVPKGYVNATEMCKATDKELFHWKENKKTKDYLNVASKCIGIPMSLLIQSITDGETKYRGTWIHPKLAINLAQWISPEFDFWVSDKIETLMTQGTVSLIEDDLPSLEKTFSMSARELETLKYAVRLAEKLNDRKTLKSLLEKLTGSLGIETPQETDSEARIRSALGIDAEKERLINWMTDTFIFTNEKEDRIDKRDIYTAFMKADFMRFSSSQKFNKVFREVAPIVGWTGEYSQISGGYVYRGIKFK